MTEIALMLAGGAITIAVAAIVMVIDGRREPKDNGDRLVFMPAELVERVQAAASAEGVRPVDWVHQAVRARLASR